MHAGAPPIIRLNDPSKLKITVKRLGRDRNPVVIVDNALANPDAVRAHALGSALTAPLRGVSQYPGYTTACTLRGMKALGQWAARYLWSDVYGLDPDEETSLLSEVVHDSFFGLCAPAPKLRYLNVHTDTQFWAATLIYLSPDEEHKSGTSFWRHVPTGLESLYGGPDPFRRMILIEEIFGAKLVEPARRAMLSSSASSYPAWVSATFDDTACMPFPDSDHGPWKRIGYVPARYNRLAIYPSWQFHSLSLKPSWRVARSLKDARLTLNGFIQHPALDAFSHVPVQKIAGLEG